MSKSCPACGSCGMPLVKPEDFALGDPASVYCRFCTDEKGALLPFESILQGTAKFYVESQGVDLEAATQMAKEMLLEMPAWKEIK
jgi:hypothetical protein